MKNSLLDDQNSEIVNSSIKEVVLLITSEEFILHDFAESCQLINSKNSFLNGTLSLKAHQYCNRRAFLGVVVSTFSIQLLHTE